MNGCIICFGSYSNSKQKFQQFLDEYPTRNHHSNPASTSILQHPIPSFPKTKSSLKKKKETKLHLLHFLAIPIFGSFCTLTIGFNEFLSSISFLLSIDASRHGKHLGLPYHFIRSSKL